MTYVIGVKPVPKKTRMIELTRSTTQSVNAGDVVKFDTVRTTQAGGGVSNNSTTGEITLSSSYRYLVIASLDVERASTTESIRLAFFDGTTELVPSTGGFDATWEYHSASGTTGQPNSTLQAWYMPTAAAASPITLKIFDVGNSSTSNTTMSVIIIETEV